jgi:hypothetical protein
MVPDAALLMDQLKKIHAGEISRWGGIKAYEAEMQERGYAAVLRSRQAAFDGHDWDAIVDTSPLIGGSISACDGMMLIGPIKYIYFSIFWLYAIYSACSISIFKPIHGLRSTSLRVRRNV